MKKIIIVDNDEATLDVTKIIFERAGYDVTIFADANDILKGAFEEPAIFIIDKQLDGVDGLLICEHLKKRPNSPLTPIIIFSASSYLQLRAKEAGADAFVQKPFDTKELLALVAHLTTPDSNTIDEVK